MATSTELVFILDKSGSMAGLELDTIGGFNAMLQKQQALPGECRITTALFDNNYELLHDRIDLAAVAPITEREYFVGGSTALIDAIGRTIHKISNAQYHTDAAHRAEKVMVVIITDGMENASHEYRADQVKREIERQKELGWEFVFLGANIDAVETAGRFGIGADRAVDYLADAAGTELNFAAMSNAAADVRMGAPMSDAPFAEIRRDAATRSRD